MCGITGFISKAHNINDLERLAQNMVNTLQHRGPDNSGTWADVQLGVALAHRRLAIIDLSPTGHQPMMSDDNRYTLIFNGEIYNHQTLRSELPHNWKSHSDTETLLAAFSHWGIEKTLQSSIGMFALALWDRAEKTLTLARDRMGEKPLYYGWHNHTFLFGSELKALKAFPKFNPSIDRQALSLLLKHNYIPAPYTIYQDIKKLPQGTYLSLPYQSIDSSTEIEPKHYWSLKEVIHTAKRSPFNGSANEASDILEAKLTASIERQQLSDVPLGAFLSGGIDSSTIVALMQKNTAHSVKTFTIGTDNADYNEAKHAKAIAQHLGTEHTEFYVSSRNALDIIPNLPQLYDEPFADSSQIPTYIVAKLAQQHVTVALSGDAGDELFAGYNRYFWAERIWKKITIIPSPLRPLFAKLLKTISIHQWDTLNKLTKQWQPNTLHNHLLGDKIHKLADCINQLSNTNDLDSLYRSLVSEWGETSPVISNYSSPNTLLTTPEIWPKLSSHQERMMYLDSMTYLPDDILTKVDRAAMATSLETRIPFLDPDIIQFAWRIPLKYKIHNNQGKWLLRQVLYRHIPKELIERPKQGFSLPIDQWLRTDLRDWAETLLDPDILRQQGYLNTSLIRQRWQEHLSGNRNWQYSLWSVLMFQAWLMQTA